ncbi:MAG TPA: mammalian cell entry protein, partial [Chitinophagaceae bacterium]|nr:mammalian cell entry protein [Chitinophagaceae bacterium]
DPRTQNNLQEMVANLKASSESLKAMMDQQNGALARSLSNVASITGNLKDNNHKVDTIVDNIQALSGKLKNLQMDETLVSVNKTLASLNAVLNKANSKEGSLGLLLNDPKLYQELRQTNRSLNILLDDFRTHPKRYVNVSVFGKKDKSGPLDKPIYDSIPK